MIQSRLTTATTWGKSINNYNSNNSKRQNNFNKKKIQLSGYQIKSGEEKQWIFLSNHLITNLATDTGNQTSDVIFFHKRNNATLFKKK